MSTQIFERRGRAAVIAAACLTFLAGCEGAPGLVAQGLGERPPQAIRVAQREIIVQGPPGYCVDPATAQDRAAGSFVMLGSCAMMTGSGSSPDVPGVLTALVSAKSDLPLAPSPDQLREFFTSPDGRAALAHDGLPASVTLLETAAEGDALLMRVRDLSADRPADLSDLSWRAVFPLGDRLVALSVTGLAERPVGSDEARATLRTFVAAMRAANAPLRPAPRPEDPT